MCEMAPKLHRKIVKFQIDSVKIDVYDIFSFCCQHDDSSVRKHSILTIDGFLDELKEYDDFVSKFEKLLFDSCDLVQMAAIEVFRDILAILMNTQNAEKWSEFAKIKIESLIKSDSWRIRRKVCDNFCRWTRLLSNFDIKNFVIKSFLDFSDDAENEVVFSAASNIVNFAKFVDDKQVEKEFLGAFKNIVAIGHKDTLIAAVANLSALLKLVSADFSKNDCEEIFQTILNLEDEISIVFIMNLDKLENFSLIEDFATKLNTKFLDLLKNPNWRIRMKAAQYLCEFLKILVFDFSQ
ncbi:protein phosphatase 2A structural subunit, variant 2 [Bonamia ostreae]